MKGVRPNVIDYADKTIKYLSKENFIVKKPTSYGLHAKKFAISYDKEWWLPFNFQNYNTAVTGWYESLISQ